MKAAHDEAVNKALNRSHEGGTPTTMGSCYTRQEARNSQALSQGRHRNGGRGTQAYRMWSGLGAELCSREVVPGITAESQVNPSLALQPQLGKGQPASWQ